MKARNIFFVSLGIFFCVDLMIFAMQGNQSVEEDQSSSPESSHNKYKKCMLAANCCDVNGETCKATFSNETAFYKHVNTSIKNYFERCKHALKSIEWREQKKIESKCPWKGCDKWFKDSNFRRNFIRHLRNYHTGEIPFRCKHDECTYSGVVIENLKRHVAQRHKQLNEDVVFEWYAHCFIKGTKKESLDNAQDIREDENGGMFHEELVVIAFGNNATTHVCYPEVRGIDILSDVNKSAEVNYFDIEINGELIRLENLINLLF